MPIILNDLGLSDKKIPPIFCGETAEKFLIDNNYKNKNSILKERGFFSFKEEEIPEIYKKTGVVLIFNYGIGTFAHELVHAKQYQTKPNLFDNESMKLHEKIYIYHIAEREAFDYALKYLKLAKLPCFYYAMNICGLKLKFLFKLWIVILSSKFNGSYKDIEHLIVKSKWNRKSVK